MEEIKLNNDRSLNILDITKFYVLKAVWQNSSYGIEYYSGTYDLDPPTPRYGIFLMDNNFNLIRSDQARCGPLYVRQDHQKCWLDCLTGAAQLSECETHLYKFSSREDALETHRKEEF